MRRFFLGGASLALAVLIAPAPARAQMGGIALGGAIGHTAITGSRGGDFKSGLHLEGLADVSLPLVPIGLRGELGYDQLDATTSGDPALKVASAVANATFSLPFPVIHPYAIGGIGYYYANSSLNGSRQGKAGLNGGVGVELKLPVIRIFAEARYHSISFSGGHVNLIPLSIGLVL